jgi:hypothetical protein
MFVLFQVVLFFALTVDADNDVVDVDWMVNY